MHPIRCFLILAFPLLLQSVQCQEEDGAVTNFRNYLRIPTVSWPEPWENYEKAIEFLKEQARELDWSYLELDNPRSFAFWLTWNGSDPSLPSVLFNTHMDVVDVDPSKWIYPPFDAHKDDEGYIYARGSTDMKCATMAQLEAVRRLKASGFSPLRTIHFSIMPDEERGGARGTQQFVKTEQFKALNVGVDIDEGGVHSFKSQIPIRYTEKISWKFNITAKGTSGHGSGLPQFTAGQRLTAAINGILEFRQAQWDRMENENVPREDLTVVNLVRLGGGFANNVIPNELWATFDLRIRILPGWNFSDVENLLSGIADEARLGNRDDPDNEVAVTYISNPKETGESVADDSNPWWTVLQESCKELNVTCPPVVANGATDGRYLRSVGVPTFGVGPFLNTQYAAHTDNEKIHEREFLNGIDRFEVIIRNLASLPSQTS